MRRYGQVVESQWWRCEVHRRDVTRLQAVLGLDRWAGLRR